MTIVGIDPGLNGGIAILMDWQVVAIYVMPLLINAQGKNEISACKLNNYIVGVKADLVVLEQVHAFPQDARVSLATFMKGTGKIKAVIELNGYPCIEPTPQSWKKVVLAGTDKSKEAAIGYVKSRYPQLDIDTGVRKKSPHDGLADAICLATFGAMEVTKRSTPCIAPTTTLISKTSEVSPKN